MTLPYLWLLYMNVRYWRAKKKYTNKVNTTLGPFSYIDLPIKPPNRTPSVTNLRRNPDPRPPPLDPPWIRSVVLTHGILIIGTRHAAVGDNKPYMYIADSRLNACHSNPRLLVWVFISCGISWHILHFVDIRWHSMLTRCLILSMDAYHKLKHFKDANAWA